MPQNEATVLYMPWYLSSQLQLQPEPLKEAQKDGNKARRNKDLIA
jgi:hypothetical protein